MAIPSGWATRGSVKMPSKKTRAALIGNIDIRLSLKRLGLEAIAGDKIFMGVEAASRRRACACDGVVGQRRRQAKPEWRADGFQTKRQVAAIPGRHLAPTIGHPQQQAGEMLLLP